MKTFLGISFPLDISKCILDLVEDSKHLAPNATWTKVPHITLTFLGEKGVDCEKIQQLVNVHSPFDLSIAGCGVFKQGVTWLGVNQGFGQVFQLMKYLSDGLAIKSFGGNHSPHVTIYKAGPGMPLELKQKLNRVNLGPWTCEGISLYESIGQGQYNVIKEFKFI